MELSEKAMRLETFIKYCQPKGWSEPIQVFDYVPFVSGNDYLELEKAYNNNKLESAVKVLSHNLLGYIVHPFDKPYFVEAIKMYFEKDSAELRERVCKHCGATTVRTAMGLCSKCCRFN
jgi:hypothetical protein